MASALGRLARMGGAGRGVCPSSAQKAAKMIEGDDGLRRVNPEVSKVLKSKRSDCQQEIKERVGRTVMVKSDPTLHQAKFAHFSDRWGVRVR